MDHGTILVNRTSQTFHRSFTCCLDFSSCNFIRAWFRWFSLFSLQLFKLDAAFRFMGYIYMYIYIYLLGELKPDDLDATWQNMRWRFALPIGSMYGIYAIIGGILMVNVTIYSIHGSYGLCYISIRFFCPSAIVCACAWVLVVWCISATLSQCITAWCRSVSFCRRPSGAWQTDEVKRTRF